MSFIRRKRIYSETLGVYPYAEECKERNCKVKLNSWSNLLKDILLNCLIFLTPKDIISLTEICYNWKRNLEDEDIWEYLFHRNWKLANRYLEKEESWQKRVLKMSKIESNWKEKKYKEYEINPTSYGDIALIGGYHKESDRFVIIHHNDCLTEWNCKSNELTGFQSLYPSTRSITFVIQNKSIKFEENRQMVFGDRNGCLTVWYKLRKSWRCTKRYKVLPINQPLRLAAQWDNDTGMLNSRVCCYSRLNNIVTVWDIDLGNKLLEIHCNTIQDVVQDKNYVIIGTILGTLEIYDITNGNLIDNIGVYTFSHNNNNSINEYCPIIRIIVNENYIVSLCNGSIHSFNKKKNFEYSRKYEIDSNNQTFFPYTNYKIYCITADEDREHLLGVGNDDILYIWKFNSGELINKIMLNRMTGDFVHIGLANGKLIISKDSGQIIIYDAKRWEYLSSFNIEGLDVHVETDIYNDLLMLPLINGKIKIWDFS